MISGPDFLHLQKLLLDRCGMQLTSDKLYLVASRLNPVARKLNYKSIVELLGALRYSPKEEAITAVIEAMVTHESLFFRDNRPFERLVEILPRLMASRGATKRVRIWSAACSSGQEPYSIAMQIREIAAHAPGWRFDITGTDISEPILDKARAGRYSAFEANRGLSPDRLTRHFRPVAGGDFQVTDTIRSMVDFRRHNLLDPAAHLGQFDIVFCRNVLIYFDAPTKGKALDRIARQMSPDAVLFLGSADSLVGVTDAFVTDGTERGVYKLAPASGIRRTA